MVKVIQPDYIIERADYSLGWPVTGGIKTASREAYFAAESFKVRINIYEVVDGKEEFHAYVVPD